MLMNEQVILGLSKELAPWQSTEPYRESGSPGCVMHNRRAGLGNEQRLQTLCKHATLVGLFINAERIHSLKQLFRTEPLISHHRVDGGHDSRGLVALNGVFTIAVEDRR